MTVWAVFLNGTAQISSTPSQVNRRTHADELGQRTYAGQPLVPGGATALSSALQMVEKFADDCWRQILYSHSINGAASSLLAKGSKSISVSR